MLAKCPDYADSLNGDILGCGHVFEQEPDREGLVDCPECGIVFNPERETLAWLREFFEYEWCAECGRDHRHHTAILDPFGNLFARCDLDPKFDASGGLIIDPEGYERD